MRPPETRGSRVGIGTGELNYRSEIPPRRILLLRGAAPGTNEGSGRITMRLWFRRLHLLFAWLFVGAVVIQVFLAGRAVFLDSRYWEDHFAFAVTGVALTALLVLVSAVASRLPRTAVGWAALPLVGFVGVGVLAAFRFGESTRGLAALHPVGALLLFGVALLVARRARRYVQEPAVAPSE